MEHLQWASSQLKEGLINISDKMNDLGDLIPLYLEHGWEFAKEHLIPLMHHLAAPFRRFVVYGIQHALQFGSSSKTTKNNPFVSFKGNTNSASQKSGVSPSTTAKASQEENTEKPLTLSDAQEEELEMSLMDALDNFEGAADKAGDTISQRETNAIRYGAEVFNSTFQVMLQSNPHLSKTVLSDVSKIINEVKTISLETARKESFSDLMPATQDRVINLIQFALKHPEPLIHQTGVDMATVLGISKATIEALQNE